MNDLALLFSILALIYLSDCVTWARRGTLALRALGSKRFRPSHPSEQLGNPRGGFLWANPLPPLGTLFVGEAWPIAFSPDGMCTLEAPEFAAGAREVFVRSSVAWSDASEIRAFEKQIFVERRPFARFDTARNARRFAEFASELRDLAPRKRAAAIERELAISCDPKAALELAQRFESATATLRTLCNALFVFLAVAAPLVAFELGLERTWPWLLGALAVLHGSTVFAFVRAHRSIASDDVGERRSALFAMALSPPQAVRALDVLARSRAARVHPIALLALLEPTDRIGPARALLVDARFPRFEDLEGRELERAEVESGAAIDAWFRERLIRELENRLGALDLDPLALLAAPERENDSMASFCPRCARQFALSAGRCSDCGSSLAPLAAR